MALRMVFPDQINVRWHSEIDPDASLVLKTHDPEVPNLGSFTVPDFWATAERCDTHAGGIPCQGFSAAGRQLGAADPRHLWPYWQRGIAVQRPALVVFENVANLTRGKMRPIFDAICADLVGMGYSVRWCLLGACAVGAAHHRHRVFLVAVRDSVPGVQEVKVQTCGQKGAAYLPTPLSRDWKVSAPVAAASRLARQRHGLDDLVALALLPTPRAIDAARGPVTEARTEASGRKNGVELASALNAIPERWGKYAEAIARHEAVLGRPAPEPTEIGPKGGRRLAAAFSEWLMMLPEGHVTAVLPRNPALARCGNGVVPLQAATALRLLLQTY